MLDQSEAGHDVLQAGCRAVRDGFSAQRGGKGLLPGLLGAGGGAHEPISRVSGPQTGSISGSLPHPSFWGKPVFHQAGSIRQEHLGRKAMHLPSAAAPSLTMASDSGMDPLCLKNTLSHSTGIYCVAARSSG